MNAHEFTCPDCRGSGGNEDDSARCDGCWGSGEVILACDGCDECEARDPLEESP